MADEEAERAGVARATMSGGTMATHVEAAEAVGAAGHIIKRPRLTRILDETEARIILLCAPAGYGKTTLAREWVATRAEPVLWYSGGPAMADVAALAVDLAELFGGAESELAERVRFLASRGEGARTLAKALTAGAPGAGTLLVIDDYHPAVDTPSETLIEHLVKHGPGRVLITSRIRPVWLDARKVIYGETLILGIDALAFTPDEAQAVLPGSAGVVAQADGWPAVIGLAALRGVGTSVEAIDRSELYEFFANDLYRAAPEEMRPSLLVLAAAGDIPHEIVRRLLGPQSEQIIRMATARGFVASDDADRVVMHPLLRQFLTRELRGLDATARERLVRQAVEHLANSARWDECFAALKIVPIPDVVARTLERCLPDLLASGRVETVRRWARLGEGHHADAPIFLLADAEVAVREGRGHEAEVCAEQCAALLSDDLAARAHLAAARAAHLSGHADAIAAHTASALTAATDRTLQHEALWLAFLAAYERQDPAASEHLDRLCNFEGGSAEFALRGICARGLSQFEAGQVPEAIETTRSGDELLRRVRDPLLRTNYLNLLGHALLVNGRYELALEVSAQQLEEAEKSGLAFVTAYAMLLKAGSEIGLRHLRHARSTLARLERTRPRGDASVATNARLLAARLKIATGNADRAHELLRELPVKAVPPALLGEYLAYRGLVEAAVGSVTVAEGEFNAALAQSTYVEALAVTTLGRGIRELRLKPHDSAGAANAVRRALDLGHRDGVVTACRAFPPLVAACVSSPAISHDIVALLADSRDADLARAAGRSIPREMRRNDGLSNRERDVGALLCEGLTNREIARTLFLSESTVKVHVRHVFEKLGVHSRAEAAAALAELE